MKPEIFSEVLRKANGTEKALKIAERCYRETAPQHWSSIPESSVFYPMNRQGKIATSDKRSFQKLHAFWSNVYFILKKKYARK